MNSKFVAIALLFLASMSSVEAKDKDIHFTVKGQLWTLTFVDDNIVDGEPDCTKAAPCDGITYCKAFPGKKAHTIYIVKQTDEVYLQSTVTHEIMHALSGCDDSVINRHQFIYQTADDL